jgi:hypothetical protein
MTSALLFAAGVVVDLLWTFLVLAIDRGWPFRAAAAQLVFTVVAIGATLACIEVRTPEALLMYAAGGAVGTYLVVKYGRR